MATDDAPSDKQALVVEAFLTQATLWSMQLRTTTIEMATVFDVLENGKPRCSWCGDEDIAIGPESMYLVADGVPSRYCDACARRELGDA